MSRAGAIGLALAALAACKGEHRAPPAPAPDPHDPHDPHAGLAPADAAGPDANLDACRAALPQIARRPLGERAQALLDACQPCGDWTPLLQWNTRSDDHGPTRAAIEQAMAACRAYCDGHSKQRFLGSLDNARGQSTRQPWRLLGEACQDAVSAVPDTRYMSAPYFALDRIARALGDAASAIEIALPPVGVNGVGFELPSVAYSEPDAGPRVITVDGLQLQLGTLPTARLTAHGLVVHGDYPGPRVAPGELAAQLGKPRAGEPPAIVIAPHALPASRIVDAMRAAAQPVQLAAATPSPTGWIVAGRIPIALITQPGPHPTVVPLTAAANNDRELLAPNAAAGAFTIVIDRSAQVADLAKLVSDLAARGVREVTLTTTNAPPPARVKP